MNTAHAIALSESSPAVGAANDNHIPSGKHFWPARDRLRTGRLMRTPEANQAGLVALSRLAHDLAGGARNGWSEFGESSGVDDDVADGFDEHLKLEFATGDHILKLYLGGDLEYRRIDGALVAVQVNGKKAYQIDDRLRGELGPAKPLNPPGVQTALNSRYDGAYWPAAPGATKAAGELFWGATMAAKPTPRVWRSDGDEEALAGLFARRAVAFLRGAMPTGLWAVAEGMADGHTAEQTGEERGHSGKYASAVGTELQRLAIEALIEGYADFDAT